MFNEFKPIPGYEGLYSISKLGQVKHVKFARLKQSTITKRGQEVVVLSKNGMPTMYTVQSLVDLTWRGIPIRTNIGSSKTHSKKIKCLTTNETFNSYKSCCEHFGYAYKDFIAKLSKSDEYKGNKFQKVD